MGGPNGFFFDTDSIMTAELSIFGIFVLRNEALIKFFICLRKILDFDCEKILNSLQSAVFLCSTDVQTRLFFGNKKIPFVDAQRITKAFHLA